MLNGRLSWNCGATDNGSLKKPFPTSLPTRGRQTVSLPQSKAGKCFQRLASKAGKTRSFWTPPTAACRREKVKKCRCSQTILAGNPSRPAQPCGDLGTALPGHALSETSPQIRSVPDPKNHGTPEQPSPELLTLKDRAPGPRAEYHSCAIAWHQRAIGERRVCANIGHLATGYSQSHQVLEAVSPGSRFSFWARFPLPIPNLQLFRFAAG